MTGGRGVRVGFIGAGIIAGRHLGDLLGFADVRVVALADPQIARARSLAARCDATAYDDYRRMLDAETLDALYICVPPFAHGAVEEEAVARRLPFFVEKPLATDYATAARVATGVAEAGLITAVGYHWRYLDTVERARELLRDTPARLVQGYWLDSTPPPAWWVREAESGGQMVEQATHILDLARLLVGEVDEVAALGSRTDRPAFPTSDVADASAATLRFASGAVGTIAATCLLRWPHRIALHLFGEGLAIEISEPGVTIDVGRGRPWQEAQGDPFVREDRDFIDAVAGGPNHIRAPYAEALRTHLLATTIARSAREGRPLPVRPPAPNGE